MNMEENYHMLIVAPKPGILKVCFHRSLFARPFIVFYINVIQVMKSRQNVNDCKWAINYEQECNVYVQILRNVFIRSGYLTEVSLRVFPLLFFFNRLH